MNLLIRQADDLYEGIMNSGLLDLQGDVMADFITENIKILEIERYARGQFIEKIKKDIGGFSEDWIKEEEEIHNKFGERQGLSYRFKDKQARLDYNIAKTELDNKYPDDAARSVEFDKQMDEYMNGSISIKFIYKHSLPKTITGRQKLILERLDLVKSVKK